MFRIRPLRQVDTHLATCRFHAVPCEMAAYGCAQRVSREALQAHLDSCPFNSVKPMILHLSEQMRTLRTDYDRLREENRVLAQKVSQAEGNGTGTQDVSVSEGSCVNSLPTDGHGTTDMSGDVGAYASYVDLCKRLDIEFAPEVVVALRLRKASVSLPKVTNKQVQQKD